MIMSDKSKQFLSLLVGGIVHLLLLSIHAQDDQLGFISIDCGLSKSSSYIETMTKLKYISDAEFTDTGETNSILKEYRDTNQQPYGLLRSFPEGDRNCYKINVTSGTKYLIRTSFIYGNYDGQNKLPEFELHLGPDLWEAVKLDGVSIITSKELIHIPQRNYLHICLVNTGNGVPFISAIELRPLPNATYQTRTGSLVLNLRFDTGQAATNRVAYRYPVDVHDRIWFWYEDGNNWAQLNTSSTINSGQNLYQLPPAVMSTAATTKDGQTSLNLWLVAPDNAVETEFCVFMHFAEVEQLQPNQSRQMYITWNGQLVVGQFSSNFFPTITFSVDRSVRAGSYDLSTVKALNSSLPPILNAIEIYMVKEFAQSETNQEDIKAITNIKSTYNIHKNWQGDPCSPQAYVWEGLECSYQKNEAPRIISLDLSSSGLTGEIAPSISKLEMIQTLDLSNNNLTGSIPGSLSQLQNLNVLKLEKNKLAGSVPVGLNSRGNNGSLSLSLCENPNLKGQVSCQKKKRNIVLFVVLSIVGSSILVLSCATSIWGHCFLKATKGLGVPPMAQGGRSTEMHSSIPVERKVFTNSEIIQITNNFSERIGLGGYGEVFRGTLPDQRQVAVKRLLPSDPIESIRTFKIEIEILMKVSHRNVVSLIGYCGEDGAVALVYEYLPNGSLQEKLFGAPRPNPVVPSAPSPSPSRRRLDDNVRSAQQSNGQSGSSLSQSAFRMPRFNPASSYHTAPDGVLPWKNRLKISVDISRGLVYLHNHYDTPVVHRDIKPANILLTENLGAKIGDFGIAKVFATESSTHATTRSTGTFGYLDPEYDNTGRLTKRSDVYSFGIVLLELITGRAAILAEVQSDGTQVRINIGDWVRRADRNGPIENIVDPNLQGRYNTGAARKAIDTAIKCSSRKSTDRPVIADVFNDLKACLKIENSEERTAANDEAASPGWWRHVLG